MKTVIIRAERITKSSLSAVIPSAGVASVRVTHNSTGRPTGPLSQGYRSHRNPLRFNPTVRIELLVDDDAAGTVFDAVSFAYESGFFSDAEMWVESPALPLSA